MLSWFHLRPRWPSAVTASSVVCSQITVNAFSHSAQGWASECPNVKNYKCRLNPVCHRMLYRCTHMATVGVRGLKSSLVCEELTVMLLCVVGWRSSEQLVLPAGEWSRDVAQPVSSALHFPPRLSCHWDWRSVEWVVMSSPCCEFGRGFVKQRCRLMRHCIKSVTYRHLWWSCLAVMHLSWWAQMLYVGHS